MGRRHLRPAGNRPISLIYPNHFPLSPPLVLPRGDTTRWSQHQYGPGGEFCLEYGPDNWHQDISGADMIESAHRLLEGEQPEPGVAAEVASRHATTIGQDLRGDQPFPNHAPLMKNCGISPKLLWRLRA
jgi:sulfur-carrier protein adenylyltransferase/sulfurtransferase